MSKIQCPLRQGSKMITKLICNNTWARKAPGLNMQKNGEPKISFPAKINATYKKHGRMLHRGKKLCRTFSIKTFPKTLWEKLKETVM